MHKHDLPTHSKIYTYKICKGKMTGPLEKLIQAGIIEATGVATQPVQRSPGIWDFFKAEMTANGNPAQSPPLGAAAGRILTSEIFVAGQAPQEVKPSNARLILGSILAETGLTHPMVEAAQGTQPVASSHPLRDTLQGVTAKVGQELAGGALALVLTDFAKGTVQSTAPVQEGPSIIQQVSEKAKAGTSWAWNVAKTRHAQAQKAKAEATAQEKHDKAVADQEDQMNRVKDFKKNVADQEERAAHAHTITAAATQATADAFFRLWQYKAAAANGESPPTDGSHSPSEPPEIIEGTATDA